MPRPKKLTERLKEVVDDWLETLKSLPDALAPKPVPVPVPVTHPPTRR